jgi:DNA replication and repair protein RecF
MWVKRLKVQNFRNLRSATLEVGGPGAYVLHGRNGAGKTSLLEALSFLAPGRGLHRAGPDEVRTHAAPDGGFFADIVRPHGPLTVGMRFGQGQRQVNVNGQRAQSQAELAAVGPMAWFTPEMDRLFADAPTPRRRFLDRLVYGRFPEHAAGLGRYTHHLQARAKLLKTPSPDADWLAQEEHQLAAHGALVAQRRAAYLAELTPHLSEVRVALSAQPDDAATLTGLFAKNRARDAKFGVTHAGPHRTELTGALGDIPLHEASMGQHKRAVLGLLIGHARLLKAALGEAPCLLLDEAAAHLDAAARHALYAELLNLGAQLWMTGTEPALFADLPGATFLHVDDGAVHAG